MECAGGGESVHAGHFPIHEDEVEFAGGGDGDGFFAGVYESGLAAELEEHEFEDAAVDGVIFDDENAGGAAGEAGEAGGGSGKGGHAVEGEGEGEAGTFSLFRGDIELTAHEFGEAVGDRESEAGAAGPAGDVVFGLREGFKEALLIFGGDADTGVGDGEAGGEFGGTVGEEGEAEGDFALVSELDGVADEVDEDLAEAEFVGGDEEGVVGESGEGEADAFFDGAGAEEAFDFLELSGEGDGGEADIDFAGFDFGEVENFVEEAKEGVARIADGGGEFALVGGEVGLEQEADHAEDAVHGGADFVAHFGQEGGFGAVGGFGGFTGMAEAEGLPGEEEEGEGEGGEAVPELVGAAAGFEEFGDGEELAGGDDAPVEADGGEASAAGHAVEFFAEALGGADGVGVVAVGGDGEQEDPVGEGVQGDALVATGFGLGGEDAVAHAFGDEGDIGQATAEGVEGGELVLRLDFGGAGGDALAPAGGLAAAGAGEADAGPVSGRG